MNYKITDIEKFEKVEDVELDGSPLYKDLTSNDLTGFIGDITIWLDGEQKVISGEHGLSDYENDFGFIITV